MDKSKVIIDPGHGGTDPGTSYGTIMEKNLALDISLKLRNELINNGYDVVMTRDKDVRLTPSTRAGIIRNSGADLCISNHINAGGGIGSEVIQSIHSDGVLASILLDNLVETGMRRRRVYSRESSGYPGEDYYYVIRETKPVETVIIEYGFIDNQEDRRRLELESFRLELAQAVSRGIDKYLFKEKPEDTPDDLAVIIVDFNGHNKYFPIEKKQLINGRWYLEARSLTEMAGGKVSWDSQRNIAVFDFRKP